MATITLQGTPVHTSGRLPEIGSEAPDFCLVNQELDKITLAHFKGKTKLLNIVPSIDTPVCAASTRKFNDAAAKRPSAAFLVVSADLPFALSRFCNDESLQNVTPLSTMQSPKFAQDYGVLIEDGPLAGLCARSVIVLDDKHQVLHAELVEEIGNEPDYEAALAVMGEPESDLAGN